jgi:hypothetical protein
VTSTIRLSPSTDLSGPGWAALGLVVVLAVGSLVSQANLIPGHLPQPTQTTRAPGVEPGAIDVARTFPVSP